MTNVIFSKTNAKVETEKEDMSLEELVNYFIKKKKKKNLKKKKNKINSLVWL